MDLAGAPDTQRADGIKLPPAPKVEAALAANAFFRFFKSEDPSSIVTPEMIREVPAGTELFKYQDPSDGFYLLLRGHVEVTVSDPVCQKNIAIASFQSGSFFGEFGALDKGRRSGTATTTTGCQLACLPKDLLLDIIGRSKRPELLDFTRNIIDEVLVANKCYVEQAEKAAIGVAAAKMAHDLRNPLTILLISAERISSKATSEEVRRLANEIHLSGRKFSALIDDVMLFSKLQGDNGEETSERAEPTNPVPLSHSGQSLALSPDAIAAFSRNSFFELFSSVRPDTLAHTVELIPLSAGEILFREGDPSSDVYFHLSGGPIEILKAAKNGSEIRIATIESGDFLGYYRMLGLSSRSASARATSDSIVGRCSVDTLKELLDQVDSSDILRFMRHIVRVARIGNSQYARQNRLATLAERTRSFLAQGSPLIGHIDDLTSGMEAAMRDEPPLLDLHKKIGHELGRIRSMLRDIQTCSSGDVALKPAQTDVSSVFDELNQSFASVMESAGITWELAPITRDVVWDQHQIVRVLENLVKNSKEALSASPSGAIRVAAHDLGDWVRITVGDNGPGLPKVIREHLFEMFMSHDKRGGTGLGLAICKSIVEAHGGSISYDRDASEGATFVIELPWSVKSTQSE